MKVRKLLRDNINNNLAIVFNDANESKVILKGSVPLDDYLDREVKWWTVDGVYDMCMPLMSIFLEEEKHGR